MAYNIVTLAYNIVTLAYKIVTLAYNIVTLAYNIVTLAYKFVTFSHIVEQFGQNVTNKRICYKLTTAITCGLSRIDSTTDNFTSLANNSTSIFNY